MPDLTDSRITGTNVLEKNIGKTLKLRKFYFFFFSLNHNKMAITQFSWQNTLIQLGEHQPC